MKSTSEVSFGAKLSNAQKLHDTAKTFPVFLPPNPEDSLNNYLQLIKDINESNQDVAIAADNYNVATNARINAFRSNEISVIKLLSPINRAVIAQYGKDSRETVLISGMITNIRASKTIKKVDINGDEQSISQSEQSFGSLSQSFKNIVATLKNFNGFNPNRAELKIDALQTFANTLDNINQTVNTSIAVLRDKRQQRNSLYADLSNRSQRIKAYISSDYGISSMEYRSVKGLKI